MVRNKFSRCARVCAETGNPIWTRVDCLVPDELRQRRIDFICGNIDPGRYEVRAFTVCKRRLEEFVDLQSDLLGRIVWFAKLH